jgi:succinoglycan biosynthesis protein ExoA
MTLRATKAQRAAAEPRVSIVMPCFNEARHIRRCIESVLRQEPPEGGLELVVADGMSGDGTRELLAELAQHDARVCVVDNPRRIASAGLNAAIRHARGQIIVRMDAHTEYASDYVRNCVNALEATGADNVGGAARTRATSYLQRAISAAYHCPLVVGGARFHMQDHEGYVDTVVYGCWWRSAFERFGYFDEELVRNQDDEFNLRIVRSGGRIWQSARIRSWYKPRTSLSSLFKQYSQYGYWKVRVIQKHHLPASWRHLVPGAFVLAIMFLGGLACFSRAALLTWLAVLATYSLFGFAAALDSARRGGWELLPVLPAVVGCYHFAYGYGFLRGLLDFVVRGQGDLIGFGGLSRI